MRGKMWSSGWWQQTIAPDVASVFRTIIKSLSWLTVAFGIWMLVDRYIVTARDAETIRLLGSVQSEYEKFNLQIPPLTEQLQALDENVTDASDAVVKLLDAVTDAESRLVDIDNNLTLGNYVVEWGVVKNVQPETSRATTRRHHQVFKTPFIEPPVVVVTLKQGPIRKGSTRGSRGTANNSKLPVSARYSSILRRVTPTKFSFLVWLVGNESSSYSVDMCWTAIGPVK